MSLLIAHAINRLKGKKVISRSEHTTRDKETCHVTIRYKITTVHTLKK